MSTSSDQPNDQPPPDQPPGSFLPPIPVPPPPPPPPPGGYPPGGFLTGSYPPGYTPPGYTPGYVPPQSFTWQEVWRMALTEPNEEAYTAILADPQASARRGYLWYGLAYTLVFAIQVTAWSAGWSSAFSTRTSSFHPSAILFLCLPFAGALAVLLLIIGAGIQHIIARLLGGEGTFDHMVYALSAFQSPIVLVSTLIGLIPVVGCFGALIGLYGLALNVVAVKAVYKFELGRALLTVFWWIPVGCVCSFLFFCLGGPAIGNIFGNILTQMATPQR